MLKTTIPPRVFCLLALALAAAAAAPAARAQTPDQTLAALARAAQPDWSSPLVTTSALLEQRLRLDPQVQHSGNGSSTVNLDGGKGIDVIVAPAVELQIAAMPYEIRSGAGAFSGIGDWPAIRLKQLLASSPQSAANYVVSAWLQLQAPIGARPVTSHALTLLPTIGGGKGFGPFVLQATLGMVLPTARQDVLGVQYLGNAALQLHLGGLFWPQIEANAAQFAFGQRDGKRQVMLTPGVVIGRFSLTRRLAATIGAGYQVALAPAYRPTPLLPAYDHAWITTARLGF